MTRRMLARTLVGTLLVGAAIAHLSAGEPETVVVTLRAKAGSTAELEKVIAKHWETARRLNLVQDAPHITLRSTAKDNQVCYLEVFTWRDADIPDHAPAEILAIWSEMNQLVEPRGGRPGLEIEQVSLVNR